jgi:hypothetical protein
MEQTLSGMVVYWDVGLGKGYDKLTGINLEPKLVSVTPREGSAGGTIITLNIQGVGPLTRGLEILDGSDVSICSSLSIP